MIGCCLIAALGASAFDVIHVEQHSARLESLDATWEPFEMVANVNVDIGSVYHRVLKKGTKWRSVGHLPQGDVYTTSDQVLTVEASNVQEAYIVIERRRLVGLYLPVEKTLSPLRQRMELAIKELPSRQSFRRWT